MEHFFKPSRHLHGRHNGYDGYTGVQLAVSIEALLNHPWDWSDLYAFATDDEGEMWKFLWITKDTMIWVQDENTGVDFGLLHQLSRVTFAATFTATSGETHTLFIAKKMQSAPLSAEACSVFWHVVTTSNCVKLRLEHWFSLDIRLCSGPALSQFLEASPSLELLEFEAFSFGEAHCRALATLERTDLEVTFDRCSFYAHGAKEAFIEWLRHSQVVTKLEDCRMEDSIISTLSGNTSVKKFSIRATTEGYSDLALALAGNQGIESLCLPCLSDETWSLLSRSLWAHPRIQSVSLGFFSLNRSPERPAASKARITIAFLRLVQCNTVVHTIDLPHYARDEELFQTFILPRLEMNRSCFEDQRQALTRADLSIREKLLGRALHVARSNPDLLFRFLSENVPAYVRSDEEDNIIP
jgi:hypothetical protein